MKKENALILALAVFAVVLSLTLLGGLWQNVFTANQAQATIYKGTNRVFLLTNMDNAKINETKAGFPPDMYTTSTIVVKKNDNVTINWYNVEEEANDRHSFTIDDKPYSMNVILDGGQNKTINFIANQTGVWTYYCIFHEPIMKGQLVVEAPTLDELRAQRMAEFNQQ